MFERFTDEARRAVVLSQDEARRLNHTFIGSEHLLLGVVREGSNAGARALASFGLTLDETRRRVEAILPRGAHPGPGDHIPFTPEAKQVMEQSLHSALSLGHKHIGAEHIVLGLAQDGSGTPAAVLTDAAGDLERVRREVIALLGMILDVVDHVRHVLEDRFSVPLPPEEAFRLFTAVGERDWVAGWEPRFPTPTTDDATPGTVFETGSTTIWVVVDAAPPARIRYARVTPGDSAGTVEVRLRPTGNGSEVTVAYDLTALSATGDQRLAEFAAGYPAFLNHWRDEILAFLGRYSMPRFDLNLSLFFRDLPFPERPAAAAALGFSAVEAWWPFDRPDPPQKTLDALARRFTDAGVRLAALNFYGGDLDAGDRGIAAHPGQTARFRDGVAAAFAFADAAGGCAVFNALYGNQLPDVPAPAQDEAATGNLAFAAAAAAELGATIVLEPLNAFENPTYPYHRSADALARIAAIEAATGQRLALLYDCYHLQRTEGNLIATIRQHVDRIGHVQIADSPGRGEPGTGEINYTRVLAALDEAGYRGWVGLEYRPTGDPETSLAWLPATNRAATNRAVTNRAVTDRGGAASRRSAAPPAPGPE